MSASLHSPLWRLAAICGIVLVCGCAVDGTHMSMDSVSRSPFFGIQLAPKKKEQPAYQKSISRQDKRSEDTAQIQPAIREASRDNQWPQWLALPSTRPVLPLPRTDAPADEQRAQPTATPIASVPIEF